MKQLNQRLNAIGNFRLQTRLILGFSFLSILVCVSGGTGLFMMNQTRANIGDVTEVALPLVDAAASLQGNTQTLNGVLLDALRQSDAGSVNKSMARIGDLEAVGEEGLTRMQALSARGNLDLDIEGVLAMQRTLAKQARDTLSAHGTSLAKTAAAEKRLLAFEGLRQKVDKQLTGYAREAQSAMSGMEDSGRTLVQSGNATIDDMSAIFSEIFDLKYPQVQLSYKVLNYLVKTQDLAREYVTQSDQKKLAKIAKKLKRTTKKMKSWVRRLAAKAPTDESKSLLKSVGDNLAQLDKTLQAKDGVLALHRASLAATQQAMQLKSTLAQTEQQYAARIETISTAAKERSGNAEMMINRSIESALTIIGGIIVAGVVLGMGFGYLNARGISKPIGGIVSASACRP
jgi:hypothetical protein